MKAPPGPNIKKGNRKEVPYRIYTDQEIEEFLKEDELPRSLVKN